MILPDFIQNYTTRIHVPKALASITLMVLLALSIGPYVFSLKSTDAQPSDDTCEKLPVAEVVANGVRGAASAQYAVDRDPDTRWANQAVGPFIQLDLGIKKALCAIDIAWYRGDVRSYNFVVSNDGTKFKNIVSTSSTGKTTSGVRYNIPDPGFFSST